MLLSLGELSFSLQSNFGQPSWLWQQKAHWWQEAELSAQ